MFSTVYDFVLQVFSEVVEVVAISSYTYDEVTIVFGMLLCITESVSIYNVELNMVSIHSEVSTNEMHYIVAPFFGLQKRWGELLIEEGASGLDMVNLGRRLYNSRRSVGVGSLNR